MNILLAGKDGQVGRELQRSLLPLAKLQALGRSSFDLTQPRQLRSTLTALRPRVVVNAAAYTAVDRAEGESGLAWQVNADAVAELAAYCAEEEAFLVHFSTDYVFNGQKASAYVETDPTNPLGEYGRSKFAGEEAIRASGCMHLILRTSWVYSSHGRNFIRTILDLAANREEIRVVADQYGALTSAELIADVTAIALLACRRGWLDPGTYHLTASGVTSWHGLARHVVRGALQRGAVLRLGEDSIEAIGSSAYPSAAPRPLNSRLDCSALSRRLGIVLPNWEHHVERMLDQHFCGGGRP